MKAAGRHGPDGARSGSDCGCVGGGEKPAVIGAFDIGGMEEGHMANPASGWSLVTSTANRAVWRKGMATKANHKSSQNATAPNFQAKPLTPEQWRAIPLLCSGMTDAEVAAEVGVVRETVWSWRNEVPGFMAELEKARQALVEGTIDRLRSALPKAVETVVKAVEEGHLKASLELLRCVGLYGDASRFAPGETDPAKIALTVCCQQLAREGVSANADLGPAGAFEQQPTVLTWALRRVSCRYDAVSRSARRRPGSFSEPSPLT
jgi:hypothetical protein